MSQNQCHGCIKLEEHLKLAKEIKIHKDEVCHLQFQMSDDALQHMPDFQGRVNHTNILFGYACKEILLVCLCTRSYQCLIFYFTLSPDRRPKGNWMH